MAYVDGQAGGRGSGGRHGRQTASADRLQAGIEGSGDGGQAKIAMSRQQRGLRGWTDGRVKTPTTERRDILYDIKGVNKEIVIF